MGMTAGSCFRQTRRSADWLALEMSQDGHRVAVLTAELTVAQRADVIQRFRDGKEKVLIATNVCARGSAANPDTSLAKPNTSLAKLSASSAEPNTFKPNNTFIAKPNAFLAKLNMSCAEPSTFSTKPNTFKPSYAVLAKPKLNAFFHKTQNVFSQTQCVLC